MINEEEMVKKGQELRDILLLSIPYGPRVSQKALKELYPKVIEDIVKHILAKGILLSEVTKGSSL